MAASAFGGLATVYCLAGFQPAYEDGGRDIVANGQPANEGDGHDVVARCQPAYEDEGRDGMVGARSAMRLLWVLAWRRLVYYGHAGPAGVEKILENPA